MKLCFFGSRNLYNDFCKQIIIKEIEILKPDFIITSGDANGICKLAIDTAKQLPIPVELHFLNNAKYAAGMYEHRSKHILQRTDFIIFIHDGKSQGTKNEIKIADKMNIKYKYYEIGMTNLNNNEFYFVNKYFESGDNYANIWFIL